MTDKTIETRVSSTASFTRLSRALSAMDDRAEYHGDDDVAIVFMPAKMKLFFVGKFTRNFLLGKFPAPGMYEYVIARTRYCDDRFRQALTGAGRLPPVSRKT
jgi:O-methyltransferase involved in polyketide biosynthesis